MAKSTPSASGAKEVRLEESDLELTDPTIVMSVRLDNVTARRLHAAAKSRGVRVSELLREAATQYLNSGTPLAPNYIVTGKDVTRISVGGASARYEQPETIVRNLEMSDDRAWRAPHSSPAATVQT